MGPARKLASRAARKTILGLELPFVLLWLALGTTLSLIATRVTDWNDMTDELVWERLAISIWQYHSLVPRLHGEVIKNLAQLYPAVISPLFASGDVPTDLRNAHDLDAWMMSSAAIPAFLLARRVTGRRWPSYLLAVVTVCTPWAVYSTILVTEVVAYPLFLWAVLAIHRTLTGPSWRRDLIALVAIVLAFLARTQLALLAAVLPVAIVAFELGAADAPRRAARVRAGVVSAFRRHVVLACLYVPLAVGVVVYRLAGGSLSRFSLYNHESSPTILSTSTAGATTGHAADLALVMGIVPFVVGSAWLLAGVFRPARDRALHAFACVGASVWAALIVVVSAWDLTVGNFVIDRYLFYLVPVVILGLVCALRDERRPRWSLVFPAAFVAIGFVTHLQPDFLWSGEFPLSMDSPGAWLYKPIADLGGGDGGAKAILAGATIAGTLLFVLLARVLRHDTLTLAFAVLLVFAFPLETAHTFQKLFSRPGHSDRPLTAPVGNLDWVDKAVGTRAVVTEVPYATSTSFFVTQQSWRDLEFWNKAIRYDVHYPTPDVYDDAVIWFPNTPLTFDPLTGKASASWSPYVVQSITETRFRISGTEQLVGPGMMLIDADMPWRADWLTRGLYDDGWTRPKQTVEIRVFADPGQRGPVTRGLSLQLQPPPGVRRRPFTLTSNLRTIHGAATSARTLFEGISVCVPAKGYAVVRLRTPDSSPIPGDERSLAYSNISRRGGLLVADLSEADEIGPACMPGR